MTFKEYIFSLRVFINFLWRDAYVHGKHFGRHFINYCLLYPIIYAFCFAYLQTNTYFGQGNTRIGTILFCGNIMLIMMIATYRETVALLFDLENDRFIDYQVTILNPRLVIFERIFFTSLFTFILAIPFFPVGKLVLGSSLETDATSWHWVYIILYLGSVCCTAYHQLATLLLKKGNQLTSLWSRVNHVLINLGGFWIPLHVMQKYSRILGTIVYANPLLYISEGLRQAVVTGPEFLPLWLCALMLILFSIIFTILCLYQFKKRIDHL